MTIENDFQLSMNEESLAAASYRGRAASARSDGDEVSAELWDHIAAEEDGHYNEFKDRLNILLSSPRREYEQYLSREERRAREYRERTHTTIHYCDWCGKRDPTVMHYPVIGWLCAECYTGHKGRVAEFKEHYPEEYEAMRPERSGVIVTVTNTGDTNWSIGDTIASEDFDLENDKMRSLGKRPALGEYHY